MWGGRDASVPEERLWEPEKKGWCCAQLGEFYDFYERRKTSVFGLPKCDFFPPTRQEGVVRFYVGIRVCDASTPRPHPVSRQSSSPVDPAEYPARAARQCIPPSIPPELLASGSRPVSRQSCSPVDPAEYPARAARQWIPPSIPPERLVSGSRREIPPELLASGSRRVSRQSSWPVDPAQYPARAARQ